MTDSIDLSASTAVELQQVEHPAWDVPIICRVEVDLPRWLSKLTGQAHWEVYSEEEEETCISFAMRAQPEKPVQAAQIQSVSQSLQAEVTLYHNGYAVVDVNGESLFDGSLTNAAHDFARLSYFHASGEPIALN